MLYQYIAVLLILGISLTGNLSLTQSCWAETLVQSTVETRLMVGLRMGQAELQKSLPTPWQVNPIAGGPFKEANLFIVFIDALLVQDAQGKPDMGGINRYIVFAVPAKHTQTGETASVVTAGFVPDIRYVPGPYKTYFQANVWREQTYKGVNVEGGVNEDFWEVQDTRGGVIELRIRYQKALPSRTKQEQKLYSAVEPTFYRIYRQEMATDLVKSIPAGVDRVHSYRFRVAMPELKNLFDGSEQLVGVVACPLFLRQIFLP
jgi:hypothetical protein